MEVRIIPENGRMILKLTLKTNIKGTLITMCSLPADTGGKMNVHKTFRRRPGPLLNVLCTFNLHPVSTGLWVSNSGKSRGKTTKNRIFSYISLLS